MPVSEPEKVEYIHEHIQSALHDGMEDRWDEVLAGADIASSRQQAVTAYVNGLRNRVWNALQDIQTVDELERGLVIQYLELKSRWTMLNVQIQHQTRRDGAANPELTYRATCVSLLVEALEPLLSQERVDALAEMLAEPL
jgi:hypothetical protein